MGPCHHGMARPQAADGRTASDMRVAVNKLNKQSRRSIRGGPPAWRLGEALTTPPREKQNVKKHS